MSISEREIIFEKYEVGRHLGYGSFAKVYFGRDINSGRSVAIKVMDKAKIEKKNLKTLVKSEISIMGLLDHPNVIRIIEVLANKSNVYLIMEFAKGGELFAKLENGPLTEEDSRKYFRQLISAVGYFHSLGIYHRDLKPENLLLDEKMNLKVSDFGLSTYKTTKDDMLNTMRGTPAYVAPEVLRRKPYHGKKFDIWSCGVILFVLTAGKLPFDDPNLMNLYAKIYRGKYKCPKSMSSDLKYLLSRLLDTNPEKRITIKEIIDNPWFKKGYEEVTFRFYYDDYMKEEETEENEDDGGRFLDAFDFICISPQFNLRPLFRKEEGENCCETFFSREKTEKVVETVEGAAREVGGERVVVERVKWRRGVRIEGENGEFGLIVLVHMLTAELVVVEVEKREKLLRTSHVFWKEKLRPKVCHLIYDSNNIGSNGSTSFPSNRTN